MPNLSKEHVAENEKYLRMRKRQRMFQMISLIPNSWSNEDIRNEILKVQNQPFHFTTEDFNFIIAQVQLNKRDKRDKLQTI